MDESPDLVEFVASSRKLHQPDMPGLDEMIAAHMWRFADEFYEDDRPVAR